MESKLSRKRESLWWICVLYFVGTLIGFPLFAGHFADEDIWTLPGYTVILAPVFIWLLRRRSVNHAVFVEAILGGLLASAITFGIFDVIIR